MTMDGVVRPAIKLFHAERQADSRAIEQILYGAEEEGVPVDTLAQPGDDACVLAFDAANASVLETGIGVSSEEAVLQFRKIPMGQPIARARLDAGESALREIGANAARLVKKMPLRGFVRQEGGGGYGRKQKPGAD